jgi:hypothetical protein
MIKMTTNLERLHGEVQEHRRSRVQDPLVRATLPILPTEEWSIFRPFTQQQV